MKGYNVKSVFFVGETLADYLKVDGVEGVCNSSVAMISFYLEGQSDSNHI